jgi:hypothetical protein
MCQSPYWSDYLFRNVSPIACVMQVSTDRTIRRRISPPLNSPSAALILSASSPISAPAIPSRYLMYASSKSGTAWHSRAAAPRGEGGRVILLQLSETANLATSSRFTSSVLRGSDRIIRCAGAAIMVHILFFYSIYSVFSGLSILLSRRSAGDMASRVRSWQCRAGLAPAPPLGSRS